MMVRHVIPAARLTRTYFRRWFYWRGISRARLYEQFGFDMEKPEDSSLDFTTVPHVFGVPRYLFRKALAQASASVTAALRRDQWRGSSTSCGSGSFGHREAAVGRSARQACCAANGKPTRHQ